MKEAHAGRRRASFAIVFILSLLTAAPGAWADPPPCLPDTNGDGHPLFGSFEYPVYYKPSGLASGDFDGDGDPDIAVAASARGIGFPGDIAIMLNKGDGTFVADPYSGEPLLMFERYAAGNKPRAVTCADFDENGTLDLAVAAFESDAAFVLLGNGDGTFQAGVPFPAGNGPRSIAHGDVNGDGDLDLAVLNGLGHDISILLGNGDGTFSPSVPYAVGAAVGDFVANCGGASTGLGTDAVLLHDLDGDGNLDLASANKDSGTVSVLLGNGDGTFAAPVLHQAGTETVALAVGDLDGDADPDLVASNHGSQDISLFRNNGDGTFAPQELIPADGWEGPPHPQSLIQGPRQIALGDVDADGDLDMAVGRGCPGSKVGLHLNNGDGTFAEEKGLNADHEPGFTLLVDLNGTGTFDLVVACYLDWKVTVILNLGGGVFAVDETTRNSYGGGDPNAIYPIGLAIGDLDGDLDLDLVTANAGNVAVGGSSSVSVLLNNGDATFADRVPYPAGAEPASVVIADLDGINGPDLAVANGWNGNDNTVSVLLNNGDATFAAHVPYGVGIAPVSVAVGDLDGMNGPDLAVANVDYAGSGSVSLLLNNGDGTFAVLPPLSQDHPWAVALGDLTGDALLDLVVAHRIFSDQVISVLPGNGDGTFGAAVAYDIPVRAASLLLTDLNGDSALDLAVGFFDNQNVPDPDVQVFLNDGAGSLADAGAYFVLGASQANSLAAGDLDGDGAVDLVLGSWKMSMVPVLLGHGDGTFAAAERYARGSEWPAVVVGDLDGDGDLDVAATNGGDDNVSILRNRACDTVPGDCDGSGMVDMADIPCFVACLLDPAPAACLIADMNADGTPDGMDIAAFVQALLP